MIFDVYITSYSRSEAMSHTVQYWYRVMLVAVFTNLGPFVFNFLHITMTYYIIN